MPASRIKSLPVDRAGLDKSLVQGIAWTGIARWSGQFASWAVLLYAARVLTPGDFGLVAMAMVPIGLARLIEDLGLDAAIVQNQKLDARQISDLGGLALVFGITLCLLYQVFAKYIGGFFAESDVIGIVRALSLLFILDALQVVPRALLQKDLAFAKLALVNGTQLVVSALVLGAGTYLGLSFWSLVLNHLVSHALIVLLLYYLRPNIPTWPRKWARIAHSVKFGGNMLLARVAWYAFSTADQLFLGKQAGKDALGEYSFATTFAHIPVSEIGSLSGKVVPGVFSAVQNSRTQLTRYLLLLTESFSYITIPATIGIALVADDFVLIVIGPQWYGVALPLKILSIYMSSYAVTTLWSHILIWTGHAKINMYMNILSLIVLPPAFYYGAHFGATGVSIAWAIVFPVTLLPVFWFIRKILLLRFSRFLLCLGPTIISTAIMTAVVLIIRDYIANDWETLSRFLATSISGAAAYALSLLLIFGKRVRKIVHIVRRAMS